MFFVLSLGPNLSAQDILAVHPGVLSAQIAPFPFTTLCFKLIAVLMEESQEMWIYFLLIYIMVLIAKLTGSLQHSEKFGFTSC